MNGYAVSAFAFVFVGERVAAMMLQVHIMLRQGSNENMVESLPPGCMAEYCICTFISPQNICLITPQILICHEILTPL